jgi:hypothetical protein
LTCPECGRSFGRAAALGAHRRRAHGVLGASSSRRRNGRPASNRTRSIAGSQQTRTASVSRAQRSSRGNGQASVDRDALLAAIFPQGIPPRENVIQAANSWLDEAERLARMR